MDSMPPMIRVPTLTVDPHYLAPITFLVSAARAEIADMIALSPHPVGCLAVMEHLQRIELLLEQLERHAEK